jgi:hypothetical protein
MKIFNVISGIFFFLLAVIVSELVLVYIIQNRPHILNIGTKPVPIVEKTTPQEDNSCLNWFAKYKHIDSTTTTTKGVLNRIEKDSKQTKIMFVSKDSDYYVAYDDNITQVKVSDPKGKSMRISELKQGDTLKVVEQYQKNKNNTETFSVLITKEK